MALSVPNDVAKQLNEFSEHLSHFKGLLEPLLGLQFKELGQNMKPQDRSQLFLALGFAVHHLSYLYYAAQGVSAEKHGWHVEQDRLERYRAKVDKLAAAETLAASRRTVQLNVAAASRFIDHAIPELTPEQHAALRQTGEKLKRRKEEEVQTAGAKKRAKRTELHPGPLADNELREQVQSFLRLACGEDEQGADTTQSGSSVGAVHPAAAGTTPAAAVDRPALAPAAAASPAAQAALAGVGASDQ